MEMSNEMQQDPVYDFPDSQAAEPLPVHRGSLKSISVLDRLLLTHSVWMQLSINSATALHILQREPPGTFLVRKSTTSQKKVLCVRLADDTMPGFVGQFIIREKDCTFSLEASSISFPDLCHLVSFYCVSRDVLAYPLALPEAIAKATSHKQLEAISHMGVEFWSSALNFRGPRNGPPPPDFPPLDPADCATPVGPSSLFREFCPLQTRGPQELDYGSGRGALCFINPLFLQSQQSHQGALLKRDKFKRSFKVRVSTETSSPLSPPAAPPPPPPLLAKGARGNPRKQQTPPSSPEQDSEYKLPLVALSRKVSSGQFAGLLKGASVLSPTGEEEEEEEGEEEEYQTPKPLQQRRISEKLGPETEILEGGEDAGEALILDQSRAPSLRELDSSSSLSSLEEVEESLSSDRPPLTRGTSSPTLRRPPPRVSTLRKMSEAFYSFFAPEKRVSRLVEELSRDRRSSFGSLVQDFLTLTRETRGSGDSSAALLQTVRNFITQAKSFLLGCGELQPPIEALITDEDMDFVLEKALYRCVLKPLKPHIDGCLQELHTRDGSTQRMEDSLRVAQQGALERFGVRVGVPDPQGIARVRRKLVLMQKAYSPIDKVLLLLQACKCVYTAMKRGPGEECGADEFLPALSYAIVQCDMPQLPLEVEYMMELLGPSLLTGEGGYYLTSVYASLCLIQTQPEQLRRSTVTRGARDSLREWSRRRRNESTPPLRQGQRCVRVVFRDSDCSTVETVLLSSTDTVDTLAQICALKFRVSDPNQYGVYLREEGELRQLRPQDFTKQSGSGFSLTYQRCKSHKLNRGGAVDLGESPEPNPL
ncbi:ras and Rab interactor 1-like isoform X1 [Acipenser ruthenus]|uniref:ras and Rab interactor 1-like isoform X1 n=2 Tax=Acipenser ruthenus TaxID=7906 RepID=UPI00274258A7|nr:ras and Rab interactor 1-like isoform X1 [Acipenser ruthenus]